MGKCMKRFLFVAVFALGILMLPGDVASADNRGSYTMQVGETRQFESNGSAPYKWDVSNPSIISIGEDPSGSKYTRLTALAPGKATLYVDYKKQQLVSGWVDYVDATDTWSITVQEVPEALYPVSTVPRNGAEGVSVSSAISITYDRRVISGSNFSEITLWNNTKKVNVPFTVSTYNGNTLTIRPSSKLETGNSYTVTVPEGAVTNVGGRAGCARTQISFTTENIVTTCSNFGGVDFDYYNGVAATADGYVAVGYSQAPSFGTGDLSEVPKKEFWQAVIVKYDVSGNVVWKKSFGGDSTEFTAVAAVEDGYVAAGKSYFEGDGIGDWSGTTVTDSMVYDAILVKYDLSGNVVWKRRLGGKGSDEFTAVTAVRDGYVAVGYSPKESFETGDWSGVAPKGYTAATVVKYDTSGNVVWKKNFGGEDSDVFYGVAAYGDSFVAVGYSGEDSFGTGDWTGVAYNGEDAAAIVVKYDASGNVVWKRNFGGNGRGNRFKAVTAAQDGYVAAGMSPADSFGTGDWLGVSGNGQNDAIIVKYDVSGNMVWKKNFGGKFNDVFNGVALAGDGYVAAGCSNMNSQNGGDWADVAIGKSDDGIVVRYDANGNMLWKKSFGGYSSDEFRAVAASGSSFAAVGTSRGTSFETGDWIGVKGKSNDEANDAIFVKFQELTKPGDGSEGNPTGITLSPGSLRMKIGAWQKLSYTLTPSGATSTVTFTSNNTSVATVDSSGWVTAVGSGTATITASTPQGLRATCTVTVTVPDDPAEPFLKGAVIGSAPDRTTALTYRGTDNHTAVFTNIDETKKQITSYVRTGTNLKNIPVTLNLLNNNASVTVNGREYKGGNLDLSSDATLKISLNGKEETYTIRTPQISRNPVLPGQYAAPDIDYFDGKFWIFPATDGYPGWSATQFHAFSSPDMVNWEDEGIIMELANDNPGVNDKGVQIARSPWAVGGSAWSPAIEKKNGKYYFYYCGKDSGGTSSIGVAVADKPAGPYKDIGEPLMTRSMCASAGVLMGQAIDPSIFTDDDGKSYILFGANHAAIAELNDDMVSIKSGTLRQINGLTDFRESVFVTKANGKYHWTWSCDDGNSPNHHVNYGVSNKLTDSVTLRKENLLCKDESKGILGPGQQSVLHVQDANGKDRYFMAYSRFYTPVGIFTSSDGLGVHCETCIDEIFFDVNGEMVITPTLEGVSEVRMAEISAQPATDFTYDVLDDGTLRITGYNGTAENVTVPAVIDGRQVTRIESEAFDNYSGLASVTLPSSITYIEPYAFGGSLTRVNLQDSVPLIDDRAFSRGENIISINVSKGNKKYLSYDGCLYTKDGSLLLRCPRGKNGVSIRRGLDFINNGAFYGCNSLKNISIPDGVSEIYGGAFSGCSSLESIEIPVSVTDISISVFWDCTSLKDVYYAGSKSQWKEIHIADHDNDDLFNATLHCSIVAPKKGTTLKSGGNTYVVTKVESEVAFKKPSGSKTTITIPKTVKVDGITYKVTSISDNAFKNNKKLKKVVIGSNVTSIGDNAFNGCKKLTAVTIGTGVKKIGKQAFRDCPKLKTVTVKSAKLASVGKNAFKGINSKAKIKVPGKKFTAYKRLLKGKGQGSKVKVVR